MYRLLSKANTLCDRILAQLIHKKRIVWVEAGNWAGLRFDKIFCQPYWASKAYTYDSVTIPQLIGIGESFNPETIVYDVRPDNYWSLEYRGYNLWELSKVGICASLMRAEVADWNSERVQRIANFYFERVSRVVDGLYGYIDQHDPDCFIVTQGCTPMSRPMVEVGRREGINVVATEMSFLKDYYFFDNATGMIVNRHGASRLAGDYYRATALSDQERYRIREKYSAARMKKHAEHGSISESSVDPHEMRNCIGAGTKKVALFIGQVMSDSSLIMDGGTCKDPIKLILRVLEFFRGKDDWYVVIRLHPKEVNGTSWGNRTSLFGAPPGEQQGPLGLNNCTYRLLLKQLGDDVGECWRIINDSTASTDELMEIAALGITVNSQAGFEMAMKYRRVVVCGDAFYARKGFTFDVGSTGSCEAVLTDAIKHLTLTEKEQYRVDQFARYLLESFMYESSMKHQWKRFINVLEGASTDCLRARIIRRAVAELENRSRWGDHFRV